MRATLPVLSAAFLILMSQFALAFRHPDVPSLANMDRRREGPPNNMALDANREAAFLKLQDRVGPVKIDLDEITGAPKHIVNRGGFLSGPAFLDEELEPKTMEMLQQPQAPADPHAPIKRFLNENKDLFGHDADVLTSARITREYVTEHNGMKTVVWQQELDGIPVFEGVLIGHISKNGELACLASQFLPDVQQACGLTPEARATLEKDSAVSAAEAVALAAVNIGEDLLVEAVAPVGPAPEAVNGAHRFTAPALAGVAQAELVWLPMDRNSLRLCWRVLLKGSTRRELYQVLIDAETGEPLVRDCWTFYLENVTFNVFASDSPTPYSPGLSSPGSCPGPGFTADCQPDPPVSRTSVQMTNVYSATASPNGWIPDGGDTTLGNNVDARRDWDDNHSPDYGYASSLAIRPSGTSYRVFDHTLNLNQQPASYSMAATVQLFYWCNWMHDRLYELGFTEGAANFQNDNLGRGGIGTDAIIADAQDSANLEFRNNANWDGTSADGSAGGGTPPRIQVYLFDGPEPDRDGDLDAELILHEYTHGLSHRLVGHGAGISAEQTRAMGEGWSDFYALALLSQSGDNVNGNYAWAAYATYEFIYPTYTQNYYFGWRRYPYSIDLTKNPLTFRAVNHGSWTDPLGIPRNPLPITAQDEHSLGEVWCVTLWEARANLINKHGFSFGNSLILQLVTDGMKLCPANPNFLQARDAILLADRLKTGGANLNELWAAFAKRGMGYSATSPDSTQTSVVEAFDLPPQGNVKWSYLVDTYALGSPSIAVDGTIYFGTDSGRLYALDSVTGSFKWVFDEPAPPGGNIRCAPIVAPDGTIYYKRGNQYLYALFPNGTLKWKTQIFDGSHASPALAKDGTIYIGGQSSGVPGLLAVSAQGSVLWSFPVGQPISSSAAVAADGTIHFGSADNNIYAVDPVTHLSKPGWPITTGGFVPGSPAIGSDGTIYIGSYDGKLYAINPNGTFKWTPVLLGGLLNSSPAIASDGTIYIGSSDFRVYAVNATNGTVLWSYLTGHYVRSSPAVAADGTIYVGGYDGKVHAITPVGSAKTGWPAYLGGNIFSSLTLALDGTVFIGANNNAYALRGLSGLARSSWPMFRRELRRFGNVASVSMSSGERSSTTFQFIVTAAPQAASLSLESSDDLQSWSPMGVLLLPSTGTATYLDALAAPSRRFYRLSSSNYRSFNPYGYMTKALPSGWSMFANQLSTTNHTVRTLFSNPSPPEGTAIYKVNESTGQEEWAVFEEGAWSGFNFTLRPGEAAKVYNPSQNPINLICVGEVLQGYLVNPIPAGTSRRSSMVPQSGGITSLLLYAPTASDQFQRLLTGGTYQVFNYSGTQWTPSEPVPALGEGFAIYTPSAKNWTRTFSVWP